MEHISKHLTVVQDKNPAPVQQELKPCATGEEQELSLCLAEPKIKNLPTLYPLREALRYVMLMVGMRANNLPTDEEKAVLLTFIVEHYGGHTVSEIRLAFKMALAGTLDVENVNCYENFSILYFSTIMNAYRKWAKQTYEHLPKKVAELPAPVVSDAEFIESVRNLYKIHQDFRQIPALAYKSLRLNLTPEQKEAVKQAVKQIIDEPTQDLYKQYAVKLYFDGLG